MKASSGGISVSPTIARKLVLLTLLAFFGISFHAAEPIRYRFTFPEPQHRWMQVDASFTDLDNGPLELRLSRSSPGRYWSQDFAKNVYDVHAFTVGGRELATTRPDSSGWNVSNHGGAVTVRFKVYGDRVDGTYLGIDPTHAHINMPAVIMWAHGLEDRPVTITFEQPPGMKWQVVTQLHPGASPLEFAAPNLQYLMDSPVEFGRPRIREFAVGSTRFRVALHHTGTDAELDAFAMDVEKIVVEEGGVFGEYPPYESGSYTFLADYLPWADGDGMEHRNSTVITSRGSLARDAQSLLADVAHEFFHCWNVERIRPKSLEPFDFDRANLSGELWLAEGFTEYYGHLILERTGLIDLGRLARTFTGLIETVTQDAGRIVRSAEQMSQMAPFIDGGHPFERTNWSNTVISYYSFGGAIALALDLTLRERTDGRVSLDDFMRTMWTKYGKPGGSREGYVDRPYTMADAEATLADVSGDRAFARDFFGKYIQGHEVADYARLLARAGFDMRQRRAGTAWLGDVRLESGGARVASLVAPTWPIYRAGIDQDDELQQVDGQKINTDRDVAHVLQRHKPGERVTIVFTDRTGSPKTATVTLAEDPHLEVVPTEASGPLTAAQRSFREAWLKPRSSRSPDGRLRPR